MGKQHTARDIYVQARYPASISRIIAPVRIRMSRIKLNSAREVPFVYREEDGRPEKQLGRLNWLARVFCDCRHLETYVTKFGRSF